MGNAVDLKKEHMTETKTEKTPLETLRGFASAAPPCITIVLPEPEARDARISLKNALAEVRAELEARMAKHEVALLVAPIESAAAGLIDSSKEPATFIFLSSPGVFAAYRTRYLIGRRIAAAGERFQLLPMLALASKRLDFYILALKLNDTRILKCTDEAFEPVRFPKTEAAGLLPTASEATIRAEPVHDRDHPDDRLGRFYREVDRDVNALLKDGYPPLVVAGVEHEVALFLRLTTYPECVKPGVHGLPDRLSDDEMHGLALRLVRLVSTGPVHRALANFDKQVGTGFTSTGVQEIVDASAGGRVEHLFLVENAIVPGPDQSGPVDSGLLETVAAQTLLHGGDVKVLPEAHMPRGVPVCAVFRYSSKG